MVLKSREKRYFNYQSFKTLSVKPLDELINIENENLHSRIIIMNKSALAGSAKAGYTSV